MITAVVFAIGISFFVGGSALAGWAISAGGEPKTPELIHAECRLRAQATIQGLR